MLKKIFISCCILYASAFSVLVATAYAQSEVAKDRILLFSQKGEYIELSFSTGGVITRGNLWKLGIYRVYDGIMDYNNGRIYLKSDYAIYVLDSKTLGLIKKIELPSSPEDLINFFISPDGSKLAIWRIDTQNDVESNKIYSTENFVELKDIPCITSEYAHFVDSEKIVCFAMVDKERKILAINLADNKIIKELMMGSVAKRIKKDENIVATDGLNGKLLMSEVLTKDDKEIRSRTLFVYDMLTGEATPDIRVSHAEYKLFLQGQRVSIDEVSVEPLGENVVKRHGLGKITIFDTKTAKKISTIKVPGNGKIVGISSDGKTLFYLSAPFLTVVDIEKASAVKSIPFITAEEMRDRNYVPFNVLIY